MLAKDEETERQRVETHAGTFSITLGRTASTLRPVLADTKTAFSGSNSKVLLICSNALGASAVGKSTLLIIGKSWRPWEKAK